MVCKYAVFCLNRVRNVFFDKAHQIDKISCRTENGAALFASTVILGPEKIIQAVHLPHGIVEFQVQKASVARHPDITEVSHDGIPDGFNGMDNRISFLSSNIVTLPGNIFGQTTFRDKTG